MGHRHGSILRAALAAVAVLAAAPAWAQAYPDRPVRFVIGFGIGGPTDIVAHALAEQASLIEAVEGFISRVALDDAPLLEERDAVRRIVEHGFLRGECIFDRLFRQSNLLFRGAALGNVFHDGDRLAMRVGLVDQ